MKKSSSLVLDKFPSDHTQPEQAFGTCPPELSKVAPTPVHPQREFDQLLAQYKRLGYESFQLWNQAYSANK